MPCSFIYLYEASMKKKKLTSLTKLFPPWQALRHRRATEVNTNVHSLLEDGRNSQPSTGMWVFFSLPCLVCPPGAPSVIPTHLWLITLSVTSCTSLIISHCVQSGFFPSLWQIVQSVWMFLLHPDLTDFILRVKYKAWQGKQLKHLVDYGQADCAADLNAV